MRRREFITLIGGAAAWPVAAGAQPVERVRRVGVLMGVANNALGQARVKAFQQQLQQLGWIEGRNIAIEYRWGEGRAERYDEFAAEFVRLNVDVIVTEATPPTLAAKQATSTTPIVFVGAGDPVGTGLVTSLSRPGGNVAGLSNQAVDIVGKRVALLRELVPDLRGVGILVNVDNVSAMAEMREAVAAAGTLGLDVMRLEVRRPEDIFSALSSFKAPAHALGGAAAAWPIAARAQQPMPVIGFLSSRSPGESEGVVAAFHKGLQETGFAEGQNIAIAFRWAEGQYDRLPALAKELVGRRVALIFAAGGPPSAFAAKAVAATIPIVFSAVGDPVEIGLVRSLNQPGDNITGMAVFNATLAEKRIELTTELMPAVDVIGCLLNPADQQSEMKAKGAMAAARRLGIELRILHASSQNELDTAIAAVPKPSAGALVVSGEPFFDSQREIIVALCARRGIAAVHAWREYVLAGGLISYGTDLPSSYFQAAIYAGKILRGEKPANLPVVQPTKFELAINLKAARALGIAVPPTLLARADEVIE